MTDIVAPPLIFIGPQTDSQTPSPVASLLIAATVASSIAPDWFIPLEA